MHHNNSIPKKNSRFFNEIEDSLLTYVTPQQYTGKNFYFECDTCGKQSDNITRQERILLPPEVLILHLDRYNDINDMIEDNNNDDYNERNQFMVNEQLVCFDPKDSKCWKSTVLKVKQDRIQIWYNGFVVRCSSGSKKYTKWIEEDDYGEMIQDHGSNNNSMFSGGCFCCVVIVVLLLLYCYCYVVIVVLLLLLLLLLCCYCCVVSFDTLFHFVSVDTLVFLLSFVSFDTIFHLCVC